MAGLRVQRVLKGIWRHRVTPELSKHMLIMKIERVVLEILDVLVDALKFNEISRNLRFSCIYTKIWWYLKWNVQSLTMKIFWTTHPKNMKKISPDRESIVLLDNTFNKKFGHILAAILAILHCRSNFSMKKQENWEFYAFIVEFDAIFNSGCKL